MRTPCYLLRSALYRLLVGVSIVESVGRVTMFSVIATWHRCLSVKETQTPIAASVRCITPCRL